MEFGYTSKKILGGQKKKKKKNLCKTKQKKTT